MILPSSMSNRLPYTSPPNPFPVVAPPAVARIALTIS
jgi:hypothetical protein